MTRRQSRFRMLKLKSVCSRSCPPESVWRKKSESDVVKEEVKERETRSVGEGKVGLGLRRRYLVEAAAVVVGVGQQPVDARQLLRERDGMQKGGGGV